MEECSPCFGTGWETCMTCTGTGQETCGDCGGSGCGFCADTGWVNCTTCGGTGSVMCSFCFGTGTQTCGTCFGSGSLPCINCAGFGSITCSPCTGTGWIGCIPCGGSGGILCSPCNGMGGVTCTDCEGTGQESFGENDYSYSAAALPGGSVVITGDFTGTATFGPGEPGEATLTSGGMSDIFVARYNSNGTLAWARKAGGANADNGYGITALSDGSAIITGGFFGTATFGEGGDETPVTAVGQTDIFIARYDINGTLAWVKSAGSTGPDFGLDLTALSDDSIAATGYFEADATFGSGEANETLLKNYGSFDVFLAKYNPDGTIAWAQRTGNTATDYGYGVAALQDGAILVTGFFSGSTAFGAGEDGETVLNATGSLDAFVARYGEIPPPPNIYVSNSGNDLNTGLTWAAAVKTIQKGLDIAADGTNVQVADGTYTGTGNRGLDFSGKDIILKSVNGAGVCIIDCEYSNRGFHFHSGETNDSVVKGFSILNGAGVFGGTGVLCNNSSPTILDCIISDCTITVSGGMGAGICCNSSMAKIVNCIIRNNAATNSSYGGGIFCLGSPAPTIINCLIESNSTSGITGGGGGVSVQQCSPVIINCTITKNDTSYTGGGLFCLLNAFPVLKNTVIWSNTAGSGNQIFTADTTPIVTLNFCDYANSAGDIEGNGTVSPDGNCRSDDPLFVDAAGGDFHLQSGSPCIHAGCNTFVPAGIIYDLEYNPRIMGGTVDMGVYEADPLPAEPTGLLANDRTNPGSLGDNQVEFAAVYHDEGLPNPATEAWIQVDDDSNFGSLHWSSGWKTLTPSSCPDGWKCPVINYGGGYLTPGTTYYWQIRFKNGSGEMSPFSTETAWFKVAQFTQSLPWIGNHMMEVPVFTGDLTVAEILGDDIGLIWIHRYDESIQDWIRLTASDTLENGVGYFIWCNEPGAIIGMSGGFVYNEGHKTIFLDDSDDGELANSGWNLIRNPFSDTISWSSCDLQNCEMTYYGPWNGTEYYMRHQIDGGCGSNTIQAGASFWVHANGSNSFVYIYDPGQAAPSSLPPPMLHWKVQMTAKSGSLLDTQTFFGAREGALITYDQYDIMKIRPYSTDYMRTIFDHPEWGRCSGPYAMDVKPFPVAGGTLTWNMKVYATDANGLVSLSWNIPPELRDGWRFYIHDKTSGVIRDMTLFESYDYPASGENTRDFTLTATMLEALLFGDSNLDGTVDESDAVLCSRAEHGLDTLSPQQRYVSDMNGDGKVSALDALLILRRLKGHIK